MPRGTLLDCPIDDPGFWNPKGRPPICFNAAAARSYLLRSIKRTELVLAGRTKAEMMEAIVAAIDKKELPAMEPAMCYMLSKQGYLSDRDGHWHPHLMFFYSETAPATWGALASKSTNSVAWSGTFSISHHSK